MSKFEVTANGRVATEILVGPALVDEPVLPVRSGRQQAVILTQPGMPRAIAERVAASLDEPRTILELPDRDEAKRWEVVAELYEALAGLGVGRHDTIVGVGGGALTDVAGFVAATWLRGIEAVYVPTTMLAAVDAAIGGKTGINLAGKNLVGAFAHPAKVVVDTDVLDALPLTIKREGWAEAIKTGFIADPDLVQLFVDSPEDPPTEEIVRRSIAVKADVVSEDFTETGRRMILNFGHTIGHAVEIVQGISHGEAVSIGMVAAAELSRDKFGFVFPVKATLASLGLPVVAEADLKAVEHLVWLDKKRDSAGLQMVLLAQIGVPQIVHVTADDLALGLAAIGLA